MQNLNKYLREPVGKHDSPQSEAAGIKPQFADGNTYMAIDMKSFYASVECVYRNLNPLKANLLVADESRSDQTICLAVSPALKAIGVPGRPRLFEAKRAIQNYERTHHTKIEYIIAVPRMAEYEKVSASIYAVYLKYAAPEDIHVYSIDECFIDCAPYLHFYQKPAERSGKSPAHVMAETIIGDVLKTTGITATVGIGSNLYLSKVAMDIVAKKAKPDRYGMRIAELNEDTYKYLLWEHRPLTDFWQIGPGKARKLENNQMYTMGDIAARSQWDEEWFYKTFGIDAEILIDHAWGAEPVRMCDIKNYHGTGSSLSTSQVLPRPYGYREARIVFREMIDLLCQDMYKKNLISKHYIWRVGYDYKSSEIFPNYDGPVSVDFYGRLHPKHSGGSIRLNNACNSPAEITKRLTEHFDKKTNHRLLYRRLGICARDVRQDDGIYQFDLFTDYAKQEKEKKLQRALTEVRMKHGPNAVIKGISLLDGATAVERNLQIGGHKA